MQNYDDFWFRSRDGLNLYARDYACTASREQINGSRPATIVCIPGLTRNSADFAGLSEHLRDRFRVIAVDLRGRGQSEYDPNPENYHPGTYLEDVGVLLDLLKLERVILIGTSLGGLVSMHLTAAQSERVAAVVLNDIGPEMHQPGLERIKSYVRNRTAVDNWEEAVAATRQTLGTEYPNFVDSDWQIFARNLYRVDGAGKPVLDYDAAISVPSEGNSVASADADLWPVFARMIAVPVLLIRGELSDILTEECVSRMRAVHPLLRYISVELCGHAPLLTELDSLVSIDEFLPVPIVRAAQS